MEYTYLGDKYTDIELKHSRCSAVRFHGKCVRSKMGTMLVQFEDGARVNVIAKRLRKIK
jgi:hypothetical protein